MANSSPREAEKKTAEAESAPVCGIVMPIAAMGDAYPDEHWRRVRKILQRAIARAGMKAQLVWENPEVDVIQSAILKNIYENDVIVCDVSGLNPNVMLEAGLRLSTKRPTVIVTDRVIKPPFDIGTIGYIDYQKDLEYNAIEDFIERLAEKLKTVHKAYVAGGYKSFVEQYEFEIVTPSTVSVPAEQYIKDQIDNLTAIARRIESSQRAPRLRMPRAPEVEIKTAAAVIKVSCDEDTADLIENALDVMDGFLVSRPFQTGPDSWTFRVPLVPGSKLSRREALAIVEAALGDVEIPGPYSISIELP